MTNKILELDVIQRQKHEADVTASYSDYLLTLKTNNEP